VGRFPPLILAPGKGSASSLIDTIGCKLWLFVPRGTSERATQPGPPPRGYRIAPARHAEGNRIWCSLVTTTAPLHRASRMRPAVARCPTLRRIVQQQGRSDLSVSREQLSWAIIATRPRAFCLPAEIRFHTGAPSSRKVISARWRPDCVTRRLDHGSNSPSGLAKRKIPRPIRAVRLDSCNPSSALRCHSPPCNCRSRAPSARELKRPTEPGRCPRGYRGRRLARLEGRIPLL